MNAPVQSQQPREPAREARATSKSIDWYAEGQSRVVDVAGVQITVRFIGRKGRRGRIEIEAPAGAVFRSLACLSDASPSASTFEA